MLAAQTNQGVALEIILRGAVRPVSEWELAVQPDLHPGLPALADVPAEHDGEGGW